jgi:GT2 family glycosyltransferase
MQSPKVYIVLLNYRKWEDCRDCLQSVLQSTYVNYAVFVVDNNSGNNSLENLIKWYEIEIALEPQTPVQRNSHVVLNRAQLGECLDMATVPKVVFIQNDENAGFAAGNNVVLNILYDKDAYFWLLNPDMVIQRDALTELVQYSTQMPEHSIVGSVILPFKDKYHRVIYGGAKVNFFSATVSWIHRRNAIGRLDYISGGCLFAHTSCLEQLGPLPEEYFLYWEETDWCFRAKRKGYHLNVCTSATCYDKGSTSIGKSFAADYYYARNGLLFISKFRPKNIPFVLFFLGLRCVKRLMTGRWERAKGIYRGTVDFFKMQPDDTK